MAWQGVRIELQRSGACFSLVLLGIALGACRDGASQGQSSPPDASASASAPVSAAPSASASPAASVPMQLLQLTFTSGVKNKRPQDELVAAEPGQRVWAHVTVRNRSGQSKPLQLAFSVNGDLRTVLDLTIEHSWSYRSWGYVTLKETDRTGKLTVRVQEPSGNVLSETSLPIRAHSEKKPSKGD